MRKQADALQALFAGHADGGRAPAMAAYMKGQFEFFGIDTKRGGGSRGGVHAMASSAMRSARREKTNSNSSGLPGNEPDTRAAT